MRHSCGHKAPTDLTKAEIRTMPRCNQCLAAQEAEKKLDGLIAQLQKRDEVTGEHVWRGRVEQGSYNVYQRIDKAERLLRNYTAQADEYHSMTGN